MNMNTFLNNTKDTFQELTINNFKRQYKKMKDIGSNLGPYHAYDLKLFEVRPSAEIDNESNRIILDSFANLAVGDGTYKGIWKPLVQGREPLGLEVFSDGITTTFHILLPRDHVDFMIHKIYAAYNGSRIKKLEWREDYLNRFNDNKISDVYNIALKDHPVMPYRMDLSPIGNSIVEALELLDPGELACIQILLQPLNYDWQTKCKYAYEQFKYTNTLPPFGSNPVRYIVNWLEGILKFIGSATRGFKDNKEIDTTHKLPGINFESELDKAVKQKLSSNGFRTTIKVTVQSKDSSKRRHVSSTLASSITNLNRYNSFILKKFLRKDVALEKFKQRAVTRGGFTSCTHEASNLISQPTLDVVSNKLVKAFPKEELVSNKVSEGKIHIGNTLPYKEKRSPVCMASRSFNEIHKICICMAPPGFGKTTLLTKIAQQRAKLKMGFLAADIADGNMAKDLLYSLPPEANDDTVYLDFTDPERLPCFSLDMIIGSTDYKADLFCDWFEQMLNLSSNAPKAKRYLKKYALSCLSDKNNGLFDFKLLLDGDEETVTKVVANLKTKNPALYHWWSTYYPEHKDEVLKDLQTLRYRLEELFENPILRAVFTNNKSNINFRKMMDEGKYIILNLSAGKVSKQVQATIMSFVFLAFWSAALSREEVIQQGKKPLSSALLLDEPYTYIHKTNIIEEAINKFRKYGVALDIFMHGADQIMKHSKGLWEELMESGPNIITGFVSEKTRKIIRPYFPTMNDDEYNDKFAMVKNRDDHYFIANMSFDEGQVDPFVFKTCIPDDIQYDKKEVLKRCMKDYAPYTKEEIDSMMFSKLYHESVEEYKESLKESEGVEPKWVNCEEEGQNEIQSGI